ncbi:MAG TPA: N-acetyl-gamma-glutamyl-phosphate reductase, partial [Bacteroidota bacterium]
ERKSRQRACIIIQNIVLLCRSNFCRTWRKKAINVSVIGASGYSGLELVKLLARHPKVKIDKLFANSSAGKQLHEVYPWFKNRLEVPLLSYSSGGACTSDVVFIALPSGEAMNIVPDLIAQGKRIIDLGGDFRLKDITSYETFYKRKHVAAAIVEGAVYGLPEWNKERIQTSKFIANPGCYPTGAILPLAPLLKEGIIDNKGIAVSSLSGVSGAGRSASVELSFVEVNESVKAYKVGVHQHIPEITATLADITSRPVSLTFVPHLIPITRGIYTSIYANVGTHVTASDILGAYEKYYGNAPFVRIFGSAVPEIKNVIATNYIDIGFQLYRENNQLIMFSVIDNLLKGAAGQAVQNMNLLMGYEETEGLL